MTQFIQEHAAAFATVMGSLVTMLLALLAGYWGVIASRLSKLEEADFMLSTRIGKLEISVGELTEHVASVDRTASATMVRVEDAIESLRNQLTAVRGENLNAHSEITERLVRVESVFQNGKIKEIHETLARMDNLIRGMVS